MNPQERKAQPEETLTELEVADYLRAHPGFFERHQPLLLRLKLPHESGAATVSLVERQVAMLRQRNSELERQLRDLVAVAKANNALIDNIHALAVRLMAVTNARGLLDALEQSLREDFRAERAVLVLFADEATPEFAEAGSFVRIWDRDAEALMPFATFLKSGRPRCGPLRDRQKLVLFEREADGVVSAAMVPIGKGAKHGFLVIGSRDPKHFHAGQRVDFLARLGELIAVALESAYERHAPV